MGFLEGIYIFSYPKRSYLCVFINHSKNMKTSRYLNFVLTIIAVLLVALFLKDINVIPSAMAAKPSSDVVHVYIDGCGSTAFYLAEPIEVKVRK